MTSIETPLSERCRYENEGRPLSIFVAEDAHLERLQSTAQKLAQMFPDRGLVSVDFTGLKRSVSSLDQYNDLLKHFVSLVRQAVGNVLVVTNQMTSPEYHSRLPFKTSIPPAFIGLFRQIFDICPDRYCVLNTCTPLPSTYAAEFLCGERVIGQIIVDGSGDAKADYQRNLVNSIGAHFTNLGEAHPWHSTLVC